MATWTVTAVGLQDEAAFAVLGVGAQLEPAAQRFAHSQAFAHAARDGAVHLAPGLFGGAEAAVGQHRFHVLAGVAGERDLEIVDGRRAVHGERGGIAAPHQVDQHRRQAALDYVAAQAPDDGAPAPPRLADGVHHGAKRVGRQHARQRLEQSPDARPALVGDGEVGGFHLAAASLQPDGAEMVEIERKLIVLGQCGPPRALWGRFSTCGRFLIGPASEARPALAAVYQCRKAG
jgi:hypothetical protein